MGFRETANGPVVTSAVAARWGRMFARCCRMVTIAHASSATPRKIVAKPTSLRSSPPAMWIGKARPMTDATKTVPIRISGGQGTVFGDASILGT